MRNKSGFAIFTPAVLAALALFALVSLVFLVLTLLQANEKQESLADDIKSLDDDIVLQSLLHYTYQGKQLRMWLISGVRGNSQDLETFQEGFQQYFKGSNQYAALRVYVKGQKYGPTLTYEDAIQKLPADERGKIIQDSRIFDSGLKILNSKRQKFGAASQKLPYDIIETGNKLYEPAVLEVKFYHAPLQEEFR